MQVVLMSMMLMMHPDHKTVGCEALTWDGTEGTYLSDNRFIAGIVSVIRLEAGIDMPIVICESQKSANEEEYIPYPSSQIHQDADGITRGYVHIPREVATEFSSSGLVGVVGHEIAHFVLLPTEDCMMMRFRLDPVTDGERAACEMPADAKASEWTDVHAARNFLLETETLLAPYAPSAQVLGALRSRLRMRYRALNKE